MQEFDNVKDMLYCEIDEISKQHKLDMNTLKVLGEIVDVLKDMGTIEMFEEGVYQPEPEEEYSFASSYGRDGDYSQRKHPYYYNGSNGYRSGRSVNNGYSRRSRGYSYEDGKGQMIDELNNLMMKATNQNDKEAIRRLIDQIENN